MRQETVEAGRARPARFDCGYVRVVWRFYSLECPLALAVGVFRMVALQCVPRQTENLSLRKYYIGMAN
jgi:hypothetical protein